ncbi:MAG TPA: ABC transporter ATP-binding protein [Candidatus Sphingobacterium stercoripullorum]|nr:ABC transporter ATP-binding protein [Candidatus Sphingobacterium stercoripullorum]
MTLWQLIKKIKPFITPYRHLIFFTLLLTIIGSFAAQVNAFILKYTVDAISDLMLAGGNLSAGFQVLGYITIILLGKEVIYAFVLFGQKFFGEKLRIYVARDLAQSIVEKVLTYRLAFYSSPENDSGKLQTRIDAGVSSLTRLVQNFFIDILPLFTSAIVALVFMFMANLYVGLVGLLIIPIYFYISQRQAEKLSGFRRKMRRYRESKSNLLINLINSITVIKSFVREDIESDRHQRLQYEMTENQMSTRKTSFTFDGIKSFVEQIGVVIVIILTAYLVMDGQMTLGAIMFHIMLFNNVSAPIRQLHRIYDEVNDALIYSEGFFEILEADSEIEESGSYIPEQLKGHISVQDVSFTYPNGNEAIKEVSMEIKPGHITALVGLSGAGKSTVINLLDKFYEPQKGRILLDGVDLKDYDIDFLRKNIGLVLQRNHIFKGTIEENIRYGKMDATFSEVQEAARKAYIHQQIMDLERGYDAPADQLSGGQQQRIAIARLFLKNPPILFLDEPTANLDAIATQQIKKSLDAIKIGRTVIIISHSISQIIDASDIIVMEKGRVVESGTHESLFEKHGTYHKIFSAMASSLNIQKITDSMNEQ